MSNSIALGVSSCLLGEQVRYDGGHKHDHYITDTLGRFFHFVPVCPEVGCGLPVPREAMRLEGNPAAPRLVTSRTGIDLTERMSEYCLRTVKDLENQDLCGFIFKKNSPSSGLFRVKVYGGGMPVKTGRGLFAEAFVRHFPLLPVEEEGRLYDMNIRENFIERVFALREWKDFLQEKLGMGALVEFHSRRKLQTHGSFAGDLSGNGPTGCGGEIAGMGGTSGPLSELADAGAVSARDGEKKQQCSFPHHGLFQTAAHARRKGGAVGGH